MLEIHAVTDLRLQVVRLCSQRAQVNISPTVEHLTLHYQVANIRVPGHEQLQKLFELKKEKGELSLDNERRLHALMRKFEAEIIQAADVVCVTCIGAGDKRLKRFKFPIVRSFPVLHTSLTSPQQIFVCMPGSCGMCSHGASVCCCRNAGCSLVVTGAAGTASWWYS